MGKKISTQEFINRSNIIHNNKYDYSLVNYVHSKKKVKIICNIHGMFEQIPNIHLSGHGCNSCGENTKKITLEDFIIRSNKIHNFKYDYSKSIYVNARTKIKIICPVHGMFKQLPSTHMSGNGCKSCGDMKIDTETFINRSYKIHGDKYDYSLTKYNGSYEYVSIICKKHGLFQQKAAYHLSGSGCHRCAGYNKNTKIFIQEAMEVHGNKYDYSLVSYECSLKDVSIICKKHGLFKQKPSCHLLGNGCNKCKIDNIKSTKVDFIKKANIIHGNKYDYSKVDYVNSKIPVSIICLQHGIFLQKPNAHLNGNNCPKCMQSGYSKKAIDWLKDISNKEGIQIQHAGNIGEYSIPSTNYKSDGYCKETNTIYEYYGDIWHGNPLVFSTNEHCHPYDKTLTAGMLYENTINREEKIRSLGYNLITTWETN